MSARPRSNVPIANRVDAAVAATQISEMILRDESSGPLSEPWMIIGCLREPVVSHSLIRAWLDKILAVDLKTHWRKCWVRRYVGEIERALHLDLDPRSAEALAAYEQQDAGAAWAAYTTAPAATARDLCAA